MLDDFFSLVRESWQRTRDEKALIWKGYSLAWVVVALAAILPLILFVTLYFNHFHFHTLASGKFILLILLAIIVFIACSFYALSFFAAVLYLAINYLRNTPITVFESIKLTLNHKWSILLSWVLFAFLVNIFNVIFNQIFSMKISMTVCYFLVSIWQLIWCLSMLEIIDQNQNAFMAFANSIKMFITNFWLFILVALWIVLLTIFGIITLLIGTIWTMPAQYNAMALLYDKVRNQS